MRVVNLCAALVWTWTSFSPARADFVLQGTEAPTPPIETASRTVTCASNPKPVARFPVANGFGEQVPLAFAVRQIVPASVRVRYADGVDQNALVDWTGGEPWNETVRTAVKPLGLHVQATPAALLISP